MSEPSVSDDSSFFGSPPLPITLLPRQWADSPIPGAVTASKGASSAAGAVKQFDESAGIDSLQLAVAGGNGTPFSGSARADGAWLGAGGAGGSILAEAARNRPAEVRRVSPSWSTSSSKSPSCRRPPLRQSSSSSCTSSAGTHRTRCRKSARRWATVQREARAWRPSGMMRTSSSPPQLATHRTVTRAGTTPVISPPEPTDRTPAPDWPSPPAPPVRTTVLGKDGGTAGGPIEGV